MPYFKCLIKDCKIIVFVVSEVMRAAARHNIILAPDWSNLMDYPEVADAIFPMSENLRTTPELIEWCDEILEGFFAKLNKWSWSDAFALMKRLPVHCYKPRLEADMHVSIAKRCHWKRIQYMKNLFF